MSSPFLNLYFYTSSASLKLGTFSRRRRLNFGSCLTIWCHLYDCRGDQRSSVIYKNIILFKKGLSCCFASLSVKFASQTFRRRPLPVCAVFDIFLVGAIHESPFRTVGDACPYKICGIFDILSVGEDIILPSFIKISLCFARTTTWQAASFLRKHCGRPYRFNCYLYICL